MGASNRQIESLVNSLLRMKRLERQVRQGLDVKGMDKKRNRTLLQFLRTQ